MALAQDTAYQTLDALEQRLQRLRFLLYGDSPDVDTPHQSQPIAARLHALEKSFDAVLAQNKNAHHLVKLRQCFASPSVLTP